MTSPLPDDWTARLALDRAHVWHPFTQMQVHEVDPPVPVIGGEGCDLLLADGRRVLDGISSWWTNLHGHGHPRLIAALERQGARLDHVIFAGFTHEPALELVARLRARLPGALTRCFFSDNGSTAVEVALKMAFQAQAQRGQAGRQRFGALRGGYHGDTLGAMGVGERENYGAALFAPLLPACDSVDVPEDPRRELNPDLSGWPAQLDGARRDLSAWFAQHGPHLAAFIAEPLVQGAGGMRMWPVELLQDLRRHCDAHGVFLILDEVMTGFGRTGTLFAHTQAAVVPDLLCLSKGLTGGILPLSLTWATDELYEAFLGTPQSQRAFLHGHSFTGNPLACAVACASLALFEETPVLARAQELAEALREAWGGLAGHPSISRARTLGCIAAGQVRWPEHDPRRGDRTPAWAFHRLALDHGLLVRPLGDCLYLLPPLATPPDRIREAVATLGRLFE